MGSKKKTSSSSTTSNAWSDPSAISLKDALVQNSLAKAGDTSGTDNANEFFNSLIQNGGQNPYLEQQLQGIRNESDIKNSSDLAKQRSTYRMRPEAATQFAGDETLRNNAVARDNTLYNALSQGFDSSSARGLDAARLLSGNEAQQNLQGMSLLDLLKTTNTAGTETSKSGLNPTSLIGALASAVAAYYTGGASLAAQAAASKRSESLP